MIANVCLPHLSSFTCNVAWPAQTPVRGTTRRQSNISRPSRLLAGSTCAIVHVRHISRTPTSLFWPGQPGDEFQPELAPLDNEHVVEKNVPDAFINTGIERWLLMPVALNGWLFCEINSQNGRKSGAQSFRCFRCNDCIWEGRLRRLNFRLAIFSQICMKLKIIMKY